ncbi:hypothetical protein BCIN_03g05180 [Botrytis cinerea B05.10]|uniref:Xylanolytic transcriptional activator regulatory domain-containing protein n=1 Tax=Botryotinia fuckeliana (strain B05.10) TaxID=332648 RepID=A0A384JCG8_BOTFB|nr:hypothetical protein BCIN_03g05180 [Botrytis cinerea B05.10]ATZ48289.1 hypothetical protein BCIN_03g05180 [Botrytis cinerea B05.10]
MKLESKPSVLTVSGNPSAVSRVVDAKSNAHAPAFPVRHVVEGDVQAAVFTKELLDRVASLEMQLEKYTGANIDANSNVTGKQKEDRDVRNAILSPPAEPTAAISPYNAMPESTSSSSTSPPPRHSPPLPRNTGILTTLPNGNVHYSPRISQWNSVLVDTDLEVEVPSLDEIENSFPIDSGFPFSASSVSIDGLLSMLPPTRQCTYLKDMYFSVLSPLFHILHDPTFHSQYQQFIEDPALTSPSWLAILFVLLALAVTTLDENDPILRDLGRGTDSYANIRVLGKRYREGAMQCLGKQGVFWGHHNVQSLQALILLIYAMNHNQDPTWTILGTTYHVAIALGCHIDPSILHLDPIQSEERRRCWAGLRMLYTIQTTALGNTESFWTCKNTVRLPADVNDTEITLTDIQTPLPGPTQMSYLLFKFQLYDLASAICRETFTSSIPSERTIKDLDTQICDVQELWDKRYALHSARGPLPTHHVVHLHILYGYSHQLFLLLHRPFFAQSLLGLNLDVPNDSQIRCLASAEALLDIHRTLVETPANRPYMWYTRGLGSFHAFHAAVVLAVALLMPVYKAQYERFREMLEGALARFEGMGARSRVCKRGARILKHLLAMPSPNRTPMEAVREQEWDSNRLKGFATKLQAEQWLGPDSMDWNGWGDLMTDVMVD